MRILFFLLLLSLNAIAQPSSPEIKVVHVNDLKDSLTLHEVAPDETLYRISKSYDVTLDQLREWNKLEADKITVGQTIIVGVKKVIPSQTVPAETINVSSDSLHTDETPDTLYPANVNTVVETITEKGTEVNKPAPRFYTAQLLSTSIAIDGIPDEDAWKNAQVADNFIQRDPTQGAPITQKTEVRVLYSDAAIYISAIMYDTHPDSILHELGNRDEGPSLNSDNFRFGLDPYNMRQSGYVFEVTASGVQSESYDDDFSFDAVWQSAVNINKEGWTVEMKIPYSAIRFPSVPEQTWGVQFARLIRRNREYDQWALTPKNVQNGMFYWGTMKGIHDIKPPLRLSLTPYVSYYTERAGSRDDNGNIQYENSYSYSGGADIKWGINESFTVDMTLLPDFSQVQSDNKVKNLSAYETYYDEMRPFFKEGTQLFSKGDLLYTRRIGRTPVGFYDVEDVLMPGEAIKTNPDKAKLLNAAKLSGRTEKGLGIGLLNAVTDDTYAVLKGADGNERSVLTEPFSNYNLIIFDQQLKNNSSVSVVNTNVSRDGKNRDANVTLGQFKLENAGHQYQVRGSYSESHVFEWDTDESGVFKKQHLRGKAFTGGLDKISGVSWYGATYGQTDDVYDKNDMGYLSTNNVSELNTYFQYNKFNPFWKHFKQGNITLWANRQGRVSLDNQLQRFETGINFFLLFNSNWSIYTNTATVPIAGRDYNEPRIEGQYYRTHPFVGGNTNFTTDYNRTLAFDFGVGYYNSPDLKYQYYNAYLVPMIRLSDKFNIKLNSSVSYDENDHGYAYLNDASDTSYFGRRDILTVTNSFSSRYIFKNDMSLSLTARHYWSKGIYDKFFRLEKDGELTPIPTAHENIRDYDFNSNYLTVDVVYNWQFAPGSSFIVTYKNSILSDTQENITGYFENLNNTFSEPQTNSISLKVLYYLDYQYLVKKK